MDKTKKYLAFSFVMVLVAVTIVSVIGMILLDRKPVVLQGQIEATEIRISGKLPGRIDRFLVEEGERVAAGDTLVVINSPEALAKYEQVQDRETELVSCPYFTTSLCDLTAPLTLDYAALDSFVVVICVEGKGMIADDSGNEMPIHQGETVLLPATVKSLRVVPEGKLKMLTSCIK